MVLNHMLLEDEYPDTTIILSNVQPSLQNSTDFKYLGLYISQNEPKTRDIEINHCTHMVYLKFSTMDNLLKTLRFTLKPESRF